MKYKNEMFSIFKQWKAKLLKETGEQIKYLRTKNGTEYRDDSMTLFSDFAKMKGLAGIALQKVSHNRRMNRTLVGKAQCMRVCVSLPKSFWAEAINMVVALCYIVNRSPSSVFDSKVPQEIWIGNPIDYCNLRIFGCPTFVLVQEQE